MADTADTQCDKESDQRRYCYWISRRLHRQQTGSIVSSLHALRYTLLPYFILDSKFPKARILFPMLNNQLQQFGTQGR